LDAADTNGGRSCDVPVTIGELLAIGTLTGALARLVFEDPDLNAARIRAKKVARDHACVFEDYAGFLRPVYGHAECLIPLKCIQADVDDPAEPVLVTAQEEEADESVLAKLMKQCGPPPEVCAYYKLFSRRVCAVIAPLQNRAIAGFGHIEDGHLVPIAHSIWSHEAYYVHPWNGDVYEARPEVMIKRWTGVILVAPDRFAPGSMFYGKPTEFEGIPSGTIGPSKRASRKGVARAEANINDATECGKWLIDLMRKHPNNPITKKLLFSQAKKRWPKLSENAFLVARAGAIREAPAPEWAASGAPKRSSK
jgi:hypothetical protein